MRMGLTRQTVNHLWTLFFISLNPCFPRVISGCEFGELTEAEVDDTAMDRTVVVLEWVCENCAGYSLSTAHLGYDCYLKFLSSIAVYFGAAV